MYTKSLNKRRSMTYLVSHKKNTKMASKQSQLPEELVEKVMSFENFGESGIPVNEFTVGLFWSKIRNEDEPRPLFCRYGLYYIKKGTLFHFTIDHDYTTVYTSTCGEVNDVDEFKKVYSEIRDKVKKMRLLTSRLGDSHLCDSCKKERALIEKDLLTCEQSTFEKCILVFTTF